MRRVAVIADLHCGHKFALTPPDWQGGKERAFQARLWDGYVAAAATAGKVDLLICNGDLVDGKGMKSGGNELFTTDRDEQCEVAARCIEEWDAKRIVIMAGTPYHVGQDEDWERVLANRMGLEFYSSQPFDVEGVVLDVRHHLGSTGMPHTRGTALGRELVWLRENADYGYPVPDIVIRSHRHQFFLQQTAYKTLIVTPGLQARSAYGRRKCSGVPDLGAICLTIDGGEYGWDHYKICRGDLATPPLSVD